MQNVYFKYKFIKRINKLINTCNKTYSLNDFLRDLIILKKGTPFLPSCLILKKITIDIKIYIILPHQRSYILTKKVLYKKAALRKKLNLLMKRSKSKNNWFKNFKNKINFKNKNSKIHSIKASYHSIIKNSTILPMTKILHIKMTF